MNKTIISLITFLTTVLILYTILIAYIFLEQSDNRIIIEESEPNYSLVVTEKYTRPYGDCRYTAKLKGFRGFRGERTRSIIFFDECKYFEIGQTFSIE